MAIGMLTALAIAKIAASRVDDSMSGPSVELSSLRIFAHLVGGELT
jgi:hypothetical protein